MDVVNWTQIVMAIVQGIILLGGGYLTYLTLKLKVDATNRDKRIEFLEEAHKKCEEDRKKDKLDHITEIASRDEILNMEWPSDEFLQEHAMAQIASMLRTKFKLNTRQVGIVVKTIKERHARGERLTGDSSGADPGGGAYS